MLLPGCTVRAAATGLAFLALLRTHPPDLMLMDVGLPDIDGVSLYHQVRTHARLQDIPVLFVTGIRSSYMRLRWPDRIAALTNRFASHN